MNLSAKKYEIIGLKDKSQEIIEEMQLSGVAEIISLDEGEFTDGDLKNKSSVELKLAEMKFVNDFLSRFEEKQGFLSALIDSFFPTKDKYDLKQLRNLSSEKKTDELVESCNFLEKRLNRIDSRCELLEREIEELKKFSGISENPFIDFENFEVFIGSIISDKKEELLNALKEKSIFFFIRWGGEEEKKNGFYMIYPQEEERLVEIAKSVGAVQESITWSRPPAEIVREKREELSDLKKKREEIIERGRELTGEIPKVRALIDWYGWELEKCEALESGKKTELYFYLQAWILEGRAEKMEEKLKKITPYVSINELEMRKNESPPVLMENKDLMESFEVVTGVYGAPKSDEPDPTPFLAPFFAVAFGLALSDAGYGLLLIALCYFMGKKLEDARAFFNLFIIAGAFTVLAGLLTGTFFGTDLFAGLRIVDAVSDPIEVLYLVSVFGLIQIFVGLLVGLFWNYKQGDINTALGSKGGAVVFFLGIAAFAFTGRAPLLIGSVILMFLLNIIFSENENPLKRLLSGFGSLYDLIGYFSDVLSYSRLLALGLATGIIAMTINMIAFIFMDMIPVAGLNVAVAGFVLVFGHVANLLINALSSFIHSARLQFVEFFSKFMEGGGRRFRPLAKKGRFVEVIKK